jgi:hypothetical protein
MTEAMTGKCLCGAVKFTAEETPSMFGVCHCEMCRRWASGPLFAVGVKSIAFDSEENIGRYHSSDWAERGFCKVCGTSLFYRIVENDHYIVSVGAFDDQDRWEFVSQIFTDEKPGFYDFANQTRMMTGPEVFAAFAKGESIE